MSEVQVCVSSLQLSCFAFSIILEGLLYLVEIDLNVSLLILYAFLVKEFNEGEFATSSDA